MAPSWDHIENFVGFGNPRAEYVFLGMEEGLLSDKTLDADLAVRSEYEPYMDLCDAQSNLAGDEEILWRGP
jgi:hypothetical protein